MKHRTLFQILVELMVLNIVFLTVDEWNGLPNHIRESNSIATFKRNVLSFIRDNQNIYVSICIIIFFLYFNWWGHPQYGALALLVVSFSTTFFFLFLQQCQLISFHYLLVMQWSESVINKFLGFDYSRINIGEQLLFHEVTSSYFYNHVHTCRVPLCALSLLSIFVPLPMFLVDAINFLGTTPGGNFQNFWVGTCC